jgi:ribosome maturation factor RimP
MADLAGKASELIGEVVEGEGFELVHVEYVPRGTSPILRAYVDRPGGITISDCAELSRRISVLLDIEDFIPSQYVLEVSSPGLERPLFTERDYRKYKGQEIRLTTVEKIEGQRNFTGVIEDFRDQVLWLDCRNRTLLIPLASIKRAHLVYRFD